jgi:purine-binding chemotaxis protein CheW
MEKNVIFALGEEEYGVGIASVDSIIKLQPITSVPRAPSFVEGVTNLRGKVLPVIDLRRRFGLPETEATRESRIVVAELDGSAVGMLVDAVSEVLDVPDDAIEPPSPIVTTVDSTFITGIAKLDGGEAHGTTSDQGRLVILLDLEKVLSPEEKADLIAVAGVASPAETE